MNSRSVTAQGRGQARRAANSNAMEAAGRAGFVARGVIYVLVGLLALRIAFPGGDAKQADRGGAVAEIAEKPFGTVLLGVFRRVRGGAVRGPRDPCAPPPSEPGGP
ncbi:DUF1206 domain-containing protein, partial [Streptomyces globisporus]|uniref:DUF1206 domain-containing protein n=1 Tax=Streptomyces globisporus TaxID=1908 RepID=UPI003F4D6BDD